MPLYAYNLTGSPVPLAASRTTIPTLPASASPPSRGLEVDVTSEMRPSRTVDLARGVVGGLDAANFAAIEAQIFARTIALEWTSDPEYLTSVVAPGGPTPVMADFRLSNARTPVAHSLGGDEHDADTLASLNALLEDATLIDTNDSRLSNARTPVAHALGGNGHDADTLSSLNELVSDATLIGTNDSRLSNARTPISHALGGNEHDADTLASLNALVSDATLIDKGVSGFTTTGLAVGDAGYISANDTLTLTDATALVSSRFVGINEGVVGSMTVSRTVDDAKFTTDGGSPVPGAPVYLALGTADSSAGAGKLTATKPSVTGQVVAEVGICLNDSNYAESKTARVLLQPKTPVVL